MWNGRPADLAMSICNRVEPFAKTTLHVTKKISKSMVNFVRRSDIMYLCFNLSNASITSGHGVCTCQACTSLLLTPPSQSLGETPLASKSQFNTRRCVTSMSSTGCRASQRMLASLKNPSRQSAASFASASGGKAGMEGAACSAGSMEEYQSQHVPIRSKTRALGPEEGSDLDPAIICTQFS